MKIAIDLNDVVRDFSNNFVRYYIEGYDHKFDLTDFEFWSHDLSAVFPFKSQKAYHNFIYNDGFITLQYNEMKEVLNKQGIDVCEKTIASYYEHLKGIGWAYKTPFEYVYYVYDTEQQHNRYISQEEFREMYKGFYKQVKKDGGKFYNAERIIREKYGGKPKKRPLLQKNGFYNEQYNAVQELLEKEFSTI